VLAAEHLLDLRRIDLRLEIVQAPLEIGGHVLAGFGPLDQHGEVVAAAPERLRERHFLFEPAAAQQQLLRLGLVLPEVRLADAIFDLFQFVCGACGLKDNL
jgi:hypothetical protein